MQPKVWFVWTHGNKGPVPNYYFDDPPNRKSEGLTVLACHELSPDLANDVLTEQLSVGANFWRIKFPPPQTGE